MNRLIASCRLEGVAPAPAGVPVIDIAMGIDALGLTDGDRRAVYAALDEARKVRDSRQEKDVLVG